MTGFAQKEFAKLGLATTEELIRELIARFTIGTTSNPNDYLAQERALKLAEMVGGMGALDREYKTA